MNISFILTTRNALSYTKLSYESIRYNNPTSEIVILDDLSTDGTIEWIKSLNDDNLISWFNTTGKQLGHTITYNIGAKIATKDVICIFHSDMVCTPNFIPNIIKHLKPHSIVSGTRIEPPVYPPDDAKILKDFGIYIEEFKKKEFLNFVKDKEKECENKITPGFFAPWIMYKNEYLKLGGMDPIFAPYPTEDSDFINRLYLDGYDIIQSRDSFCYHWASRSHRWTTGKVNVDTDDFKYFQERSIRNFLRKWGCYPQNDSFSYPIVNKKYDIGISLEVNTPSNYLHHLLSVVEPLCSTLYTNINADLINEYIKNQQNNTFFNLKSKIKSINENKANDIIISFVSSGFYPTLQNKFKSGNYDFGEDIQTFKDKLQILTSLPPMITDSGEIGDMEFDIFNIKINKTKDFTLDLINLNNPYYQNLLIKGKQ